MARLALTAPTVAKVVAEAMADLVTAVVERRAAAVQAATAATVVAAVVVVAAVPVAASSSPHLRSPRPPVPRARWEAPVVAPACLGWPVSRATATTMRAIQTTEHSLA